MRAVALSVMKMERVRRMGQAGRRITKKLIGSRSGAI